MLLLTCSVMCYTGSFLFWEAVSWEGAQEPCRCSQGHLLCSALTQALHKSGASVVLNSSVSWLDIYFSSPDITVNWKSLVSWFFFFLRINKFNLENITFLFDFRLGFLLFWFFFWKVQVLSSARVLPSSTGIAFWEKDVEITVWCVSWDVLCKARSWAR